VKDEIVSAIRSAETALLLLHDNPDGDTIGSGLALYAILSRMGKRAILCCNDPIPKTYRFLPGWDQIRKPAPERARHDLAIFIDCSDPDRAPQCLESLAPHGKVLNIDHHGTNTAYGDINWVDPRAAAVGQMIFHLIAALDMTPTPDEALCLYASIVSDTGSFRFDNTTPEAHEIAAALLRTGMDAGLVRERLFENRERGDIRLLALALRTMEITRDGSIAVMSVTRDIWEEARAEDQAMEGLVNYARSIAGVKIALLLREVEDNKVKVGFRARGNYDVGALAAQFGGGGHPGAAGALLEGPLAEVKARVMEAAGSLLGCSDTSLVSLWDSTLEE